jgi:DNA-binding NtrC family response regulator
VINIWMRLNGFGGPVRWRRLNEFRDDATESCAVVSCIFIVVSETLSAIVSSDREGRAFPALHVGLAGDDPKQPPARYSLAGLDRVDLGRGDARRATRTSSAEVDILGITLADPRMSGQHARLSRLGGAWVLEDLGSKNGTWIGKQRITRHVLGDGDPLVVGHTVLVFRTSGGEGPDLDRTQPAAFGLATMSPSLAAKFAELATASASTVPIEITGESGTGKELVARAIHTMSKRSGRFVAVNCGALAPNLIEAELFGHRKGAFTGAGDERAGLVRSADGGTLFLDEIGELPAAAQASLLRVLQEHEVLPIGSDRPIKVDLRVVTATHRNLDHDVDANRFRADLRARLMGVKIELPPLRARREDLGHLVSTLLAKLAPERSITFTADAVAALYTHDWPLNVRELERSLAAALATAKDRIEPSHLPTPSRTPAPVTSKQPPAQLPEDDAGLREVLVAALARHDGNLAAVARDLGRDRTQIRRYMKRLGLSRSDNDGE